MLHDPASVALGVWRAGGTVGPNPADGRSDRGWRICNARCQPPGRRRREEARLTTVEGRLLLPVDLTGDGRLDLLVGGYWDGHQTFEIFTNNGDGRVANSPLALAGAMNFATMVTADFDGDGFLDLASQNNSAGGFDLRTDDGVLSIDFGNGHGGFGEQPTSYPTPQTAGLLAAGDFDEDGHPDLVFAGNNFIEIYGGLPVPAATDFTMSFYRNTGAGGFQEPVGYAGVGGYNYFVTGDFNGDGHLDVANDAFGVFYGRGDGRFGDEVTFATDPFYSRCGLAVADFDGDGVADLATTNILPSSTTAQSQVLQVYAGSPSGIFAPPVNYAITMTPATCGLAAGDFNGDGKPDLVLEMSRDPNNLAVAQIPVLVFENRGDGTFSDPVTYLAGGQQWDYPTGLGVGDFNGDGVTDIAMAIMNDRDPYPTAVNLLLSKCE